MTRNWQKKSNSHEFCTKPETVKAFRFWKRVPNAVTRLEFFNNYSTIYIFIGNFLITNFKLIFSSIKAVDWTLTSFIFIKPCFIGSGMYLHRKWNRAIRKRWVSTKTLTCETRLTVRCSNSGGFSTKPYYNQTKIDWTRNKENIYLFL